MLADIEKKNKFRVFLDEKFRKKEARASNVLNSKVEATKKQKQK